MSSFIVCFQKCYHPVIIGAYPVVRADLGSTAPANRATSHTADTQALADSLPALTAYPVVRADLGSTAPANRATSHTADTQALADSLFARTRVALAMLARLSTLFLQLLYEARSCCCVTFW